MSDIDRQLTEQYNEYVENNLKFVEKANKAAGTRARKALMEITKLCKSKRREIQDIKNGEVEPEKPSSEKSALPNLAAGLGAIPSELWDDE